MIELKHRPYQNRLVHWALYHPTDFCLSNLAVILAFTFPYLIAKLPLWWLAFISPPLAIVALVGMLQIFLNCIRCTCRRRYKPEIFQRVSRVSLLAGFLVLYMPLAFITIVVVGAYAGYSFIGLCISWPYLLFIIANPDKRYEDRQRLAMLRTLNRHHLMDKSLDELVSLQQIAYGMVHESNTMVIERQIERVRAQMLTAKTQDQTAGI